MVHLAVFGFVASCLVNCGFHSNQIGLTALEQRLALLRQMQPLGRTPSMFWSATLPAKGSPIWSRASQNAAALLFDLGTVDVR
jgi:hypothetical protein